jgi:predicted esterase
VGIIGDPDRATEAWLILHGHGMLARGILHWFRHAERADRVLVAPEALSRFYTEISGSKRVVGASWVTREDLGHDLEDVHAYLEEAAAQFIPESARLEVHGFSQGVSIGARWTVRTRRHVDRLVGWAGIMPEDVAADDLKRALGPEPLHLVVGERDTRVPPERVEGDAARLRTAGLTVEVHRFPGGHEVDEGMLGLFGS